ncbi:MAG TPA: phage tail sheath C-terminal domain-containing protein [Allosphingosinicella sp.]|nr:phage tail sheath C-terminal domain-containing protein [Allosphingosinicella sp.]
MFVPGVTFTTRQPATGGLSTRADVAMFVGCVGRRAASLPQPVADALAAGGWRPGGLFRTTAAQLVSLLDLPVPVTSWAEFDALYAWDERPAAPGSADLLPCPLGLAVKSFFEAGGAKAYVVRTGDPLPLVGATPDATIAAKLALLAWPPAKPPADAADRVPILAGFGGAGKAADPGDPATWSGAASIYAIEDAAILLLPDLAEIAAGAPRPVPPIPEVPGPPEQFLPCAQPSPDAVPEPRVDRPDYLAPRLDRPGYKLWAAILAATLDLLSLPRGPAHRRDVMLVSALPLPLDDGGFDKSEENWPLAILAEPGIPAPGVALLDAASIGHPRLQLGYPWIATDASIDMPEGLQSPEGLLAGLIAARSLSGGAFLSAAGQAVRAIKRVQPELAGSDINRGLPQGADWLGDRLCLIAPQRGRIELVSDSTMADDARLRAGGVSRLTGIILRAARHLGEDLLFEPSGPLLWSRIRAAVEGLLERLWERGALDGATRDAAYSVRCDESTMNQADIDNGRVICTIAFTAAYPIERIEVTLLLLEPPSSALVRDAA